MSDQLRDAPPAAELVLFDALLADFLEAADHIGLSWYEERAAFWRAVRAGRHE
jgi:hypothetical protein